MKAFLVVYELGYDGAGREFAHAVAVRAATGEAAIEKVQKELDAHVAYGELNILAFERAETLEELRARLIREER